MLVPLVTRHILRLLNCRRLGDEAYAKGVMGKQQSANVFAYGGISARIDRVVDRIRMTVTQSHSLSLETNESWIPVTWTTLNSAAAYVRNQWTWRKNGQPSV